MDRYRTGAMLTAAAQAQGLTPKSILKKDSASKPRKPSVGKRISFGQNSASDDVEHMKAPQLMAQMMSQYGEACVVSTNFGPNSAVILHLATRVRPDVPVVWVDTGYLSEETYRYAEQLTKLLNLNLKVFEPHISRARMEALHGNLWQTDEKEFGRLRKLEPMKRALQELKVRATIVGLRRSQLGKVPSVAVPRVSKDGNERFRVLPIFDWTDEEMAKYVEDHGLPAHGLNSGPRRDALRYAEMGINSSSEMSGEKKAATAPTKNLRAITALSPAKHAAAGKDAAASASVELYTKLNSALCTRAKKLLGDKGVDFTEYIVDVDIAEEQLLASVGGNNHAAPFVFIEGEFVGGFNELCEKLSEDPRRHVGAWGRGMAAVQLAVV
jgi:phosphoadenosine phosphosulfate reductase